MSWNQLFSEQLMQLEREERNRQLFVTKGISFVHNDYLGLSQHPEIIEAGAKAARLFGAGARGSRLLGGHSRLFEEVEGQVAEFFEAPAALLFSTGYMANLAGLQVLGNAANYILADQLNHASLIDGLRLVKTPRERVPHNSWAGLANKALPAGKGLLVAESLYSMDGDLVDIRAIERLVAKEPDLFVYLDEAHAGGLFFENGKGVGQGLRWEQAARMVTFGKAFGVGGAAILCSASLKDLIVSTGRSFIYTTAPSPVVVAMVGQSLKTMTAEGGWRRRALWERASHFRECLAPLFVAQQEVNTMNSSAYEWNRCSPIVPLFCGGQKNALRLSESMREWGVELRAIRYPTVAEGEERVRFSLNLDVSLENIEPIAQELVKRWTEFSLPLQIRK